MRRKILSLVAIVVSVFMVMAMFPVSADLNDATGIKGLFVDFEDASTFVRDGGYSYYFHDATGISDSAGCLKVVVGSRNDPNNAANGVVAKPAALIDGGSYRLSYKAMRTVEDGTPAGELWTLLRLNGASGTITSKGSHKTYNVGDEVTNVKPYVELDDGSHSVPADGVWRTYTYDFTFNISDLTLGSSSRLSVDSYNGVVMCFRATASTTGSYYVDDLSLMPIDATNPSVTASDIQFAESMDTSNETTISWAGNAPKYFVKVSAGNDTDGYFAFSESNVATNSVSVSLPAWTDGKKVKVEVTALDANSIAQGSTSAVSALAVGEEPAPQEGVTVENAQKGATAFTADVTYVGVDNAFALIISYGADNKMLTVSTTPLTSGVKTPISVSSAGATKAKVFVFDGTSLTNTNVIPLCDMVEIN